MEVLHAEWLSIQSRTEGCYPAYRRQQVYVMEVVMWHSSCLFPSAQYRTRTRC